MVLRGLLETNFAYCEFYSIPECCKRIPCSRTAEFAAAGANVFMQKSHDHELRDPLPNAVGGILVQVREPIARALSNYELDLVHVGPPHNLMYQRFWLGLEAAYTAGFFRKWCASGDPRVLVLTYETLLSDSVRYFDEIFKTFDIPRRFFDPGKILSLQGISSGDRHVFKKRKLEASPYFDKNNFAIYGHLVAEAAALSGYSLASTQTPTADPGEIELMFQAHAAALNSDLVGSLAWVDRYLELCKDSPYGFHYRARLRRTLGMHEIALEDTRRALELEPSFVSACVVLATAEFAANRPDVALAAIQRCVDSAPDPAKTMGRIQGRLNVSPEIAARINATIVVPAQAAAVPEKPSGLPRDVVLMAFQLILGRDPENEVVIAAHQKAPTIPALRRALMGSAEFKEKYRKQFLAD